MVTHLQPIREFCGLMVQTWVWTNQSEGWNTYGLHLCEEFGELQPSIGKWWQQLRAEWHTGTKCNFCC